MQARFLLGPAGSGKTFRCLAEIRAELLRDPAGPPLLLLAPKQATFQLERQLLADDNLPGYTRLQIAAFDRLAEFTLEEFAAAPPRLLDAEGRVMALRALLGRNQSRLNTFRATARLPGFAQQLSLLLRELQHHQCPSGQLAALAENFHDRPTLAGKLHDLSLLFSAYGDWLAARNLQDADGLLELAAAKLRAPSAGDDRPPAIRVGGLWLDGFAEMTPQELDLLAAWLPFCERATLSFCLPRRFDVASSWLSPWSVVAQTYARCRQRVEAIPFARVETTFLPEGDEPTRFSASPELAALENGWSAPDRNPELETRRREGVTGNSAIRRLTCADPEAEVTQAAHEILRYVRAGGRYREIAIIVRSLEEYAAPLRRVLTRYEIPCFLDRREPVAHHPLAELSRYALRLVAFNWRHDDWFGALKTGLATAEESAVDRLENLALENGWQGEVWFRPLKATRDRFWEDSANQFRAKIIPPFARWRDALKAVAFQPTGSQLAAALGGLWRDLQVEATLQEWSDANASLRAPHSGLHQTVLTQMQQWLANVELAFGDDAMTLGEWLPVLEAGLAGLTIGVIPPALDQILVGAIDRSRNPELKLALVLGMNEGVFPAPPAPAALLTDAERDVLAGCRVRLGPDRYTQIGREHFFGYIACTRAAARLVLTCAERDTRGRTLNPSPILAHITRITGATPESAGRDPWWAGEHLCELEAPLLRRAQASLPLELPALQPLLARHRQTLLAAQQAPLELALVEELFGRELQASVSSLEQFAECPFKFFAARTLRLRERLEFEFDSRDKGSFHHEVLHRFHERITLAGRRWRDLGVDEAVTLVDTVAREILPGFAGGKFCANGAARFTGEMLVARIKQLIAALAGWMPQYGFDPVACETVFGDDQPGSLPECRFDLADGRVLVLRGRIDRVDLHRLDDGRALAVVMDYKSGVRRLDNNRLHNGLELQLLSYLSVLNNVRTPVYGVTALKPAGVFYIPLNGGGGRKKSGRADILAGDRAGDRTAFQHNGRFLGDELHCFDNRGGVQGDQFRYRKNRDGSFSRAGNDALPEAEFDALRREVEAHLRSHARGIFSGELAARPYRQGRMTACEYCDFRPVCRFDPWTQPFRRLRPPSGKTS